MSDKSIYFPQDKPSMVLCHKNLEILPWGRYVEFSFQILTQLWSKFENSVLNWIKVWNEIQLYLLTFCLIPYAAELLLTVVSHDITNKQRVIQKHQHNLAEFQGN